jgi:uncharacterized membrane protein YgcG
MKLTLPKVALVAFVAATAFTATSANAVQFHSYRCDIDFFGGCDIRVEQQQAPARRVVNRDTSPTYMKQSDPRYNSAMSYGGGGGGAGGGGGGGGSGGGR